MKRILLTLFLISITGLGFSQDEYSLSPKSELTIAGTSTVHDWTVTANTMEGTLKAEVSTPKQMSLKVAVSDIKSERGATMDKKMHAALKQDTHPKVVFVLKEVKNESIFLGTLTVAGKSREVEVSGNISSSKNTFEISGEYGLALKDFEIEPPTAMFGQVVVGPDVTIKFDLIFDK